MKYSFVIPVYNEEESLKPLVDEIAEVMKKVSEGFEIILVDDCSDDRSPAIMDEFQKNDPEGVQVVRLPERCGQTFAMRKGLDAMRGEYAVTLDADLQNDPHDLPKMITKMSEGYDVVCGWRKTREDKFLKAKLSKFGNVLQRLVSGLKIHDVSCTLRLLTKECAQKAALNREGQHRFIPLSLSLQGYRVGEIVANHRPRRYGQTKYSHKRVFKVVVDFFKILIAKGVK
jgi:glycosyltransferase involved in cell wall biosynthesis